MATSKGSLGRLWLTVLVGALCLGISGNISSSFAASSISGHIYRSGGVTPIQNIHVILLDYSNGFQQAAYADTDAQGAYSVTGLAAGQYDVWACATCGRFPYTNKYYPDARSWNVATGVTLGEGEGRSDIDFVLLDAVPITGTVTDTDGIGVGGATVTLYTGQCMQEMVSRGFTDIEGSYFQTALPGETVYVSAKPTGNLAEGWWSGTGGTSDCSLAAPVTVSQQSISNISFSLARAASVSGHVFKTDGITPIPSLRLQLYKYDGVSTYYGAGSATTDSSGSYSITGLSASDDYVLKACATCSRLLYLDSYYNDKTDLSTATRIPLNENQAVENIDFRLEDGVSIEGRITDTGGQGISGAWVTPYSEQCTGWLNGVNADNDGNYFATVRPGTTVYLRAQSTGSGDNFIPQWYAGAGGTSDCHLAQAVVATQSEAGINFSLPLGSSISGFVFENDGTTPIPNLYVQAMDFTTGNWAGSARTAANGSYTISGLPAGSYRVGTCVSCSGLSFPDKFYNNVSNYGEATPVVTVVGETRLGINFIMGESGPAGGAISGHVYGSNGVTPIQNVRVTAKNTQTLSEWSATTGQDGSYTLSGLPAGGYEVKTCASCNGLPFLDQPIPSLAVVTAGQTTTIDFSLQEAVTISGRVTSPAGRPIPFPSVTIWAYSERCQGGSYWGGVSKDGNGDYTLTVPAVGEVYLWASPYSYSNYLDEWWNSTGGTRECNAAGAVPAVFGENQTAIDFVLEYKNPVAVSGRVVQSNGSTPIGNLQVFATDYDTHQWMAGANTDPQGYYDLTNLPSGTYRIRACASCGHQLYVDEFYPDTRDHGAAEAVVVTDGTTTVLNDIVLDAGVSVTGKVTDAEGRPISSITVEPFSGKCRQGLLGGFGTDENGEYFGTVLPSEQVYLAANDWNQNLYGSAWWNGEEGTMDCNGAALVSAGASGINFVLERDTLISGIVRDSAGNPIDGTVTPIQVQAVQGAPCGFWQIRRSAPIDANGRFEIRGLEPAGCGFFGCWGGGNYFLRTDNLLQSNYVNEWWTGAGGTFDCQSAGWTELYRTVEGIEFRLDSGGSISGSIMNGDGSAPITDAEIQVGVIQGDPCGQHQWVAWGQTSSGAFSITGVPEGDYYIKFNNLNQSNYVNEWWNGSGNSLDCRDAQAVTMISGAAIENKSAQLELGGAISGHVYQADGVTAIENLHVFAADFETNAWRGGSNTAPDGSYVIVGLPAGTYRVRACSSCNNGPYIDESYNDKLFHHEAQPVTVNPGQTASGIDFSLVEGVNIYGMVKDSLGQPITGMHVQAFFDKCGQYPIGQTDTYTPGFFFTNNYSLLVPPLGEVYIRACPECKGMNYISKWYDSAGGTIDCNAAVAVQANLGNQSGIDINLDSGASISGTLKDSSGNPITGLPIGVGVFTGNPCTPNPPILFAQTNPVDGTYTVSGLLPGNYFLQTGNNGTFYMNEWWSSAGSTSDCGQAQAITVDAGAAIAGKDFNLDLGGTITGKVTQADGSTVIGNLHVYAQDYNTGQWMGGVNTDQNGNYAIFGLPAGKYRVSTCTSCNGMPYVDEFYNDKFFHHEADPVTVIAGQTISGIDFSLSPAVSVTGRVTDAQNQPIAGMNVQAFSGKCWQGGIGGANTDNDGYYTLFIPPVGQAYIRTCAECVQMNDVSEWWNDADGTIDCNAAVAVNANPGQPQTGIDFSLEAGASISGAVKDGNGNTITGVSINVSVMIGDPCGQNQGVVGANSNPSDGTYTIWGIPTGTYYLRTGNNNTNYVNEWWDSTGSTSDCQGLQTITLLGGDAISGKDFRLDLGGTITGRVTQADGSTGIGNLHVYAQDYHAGQWMGGANTDPNGAYAINGLPVGDYRVSTCAHCNGHAYVDEFYNDTFFHHEADPVTVIAGESTLGIDFSLSTPVSVSGRITDTQNQPIAGMRVEVFSGKCWQDGLGFADTDINGNYTLLIPPVETVYIRTCPECVGMMSFVSEWWTEAGGTVDCNAAAPFQVSSGQAANFVPAPFGSISGRITATGGQGIEGLHVQAFSGSCNWDFLGGANTDVNGNYTIFGIPAGNAYVRVCADCNHQNFINRFWNGDSGTGTRDCNLATPVGVTAGAVTANIDFIMEQGPARSWYFDLSVTNGNLAGGFDLLPGFDPFITKATLSGPGGFFYEYDLANDEFYWTRECSYRVAWHHNFSGPVTYGDYTLSLHFTDGVVQTSVRTLLEAHPVAVNPASIAWTVNEDGSMDVSWAAPAGAPPEQVYQVGIFRDGQRYFTAANLTQTSLLIPANSLRCLENGPASSYELQVRAYDSGQNAREDGTNVSFDYNPSALDSRVTYFEAANSDGYLSMYFNVRPGSRSSVSSATVSGPEGFSPYTFNLTNDWVEMSTESRTLNGWSKKSSIQTILYGTYTLIVDFTDGYQQVRTYTLNQVAIIPVDSLSFEIYPDGAIRFNWVNPQGVSGQKYNVRIRNEDESKEYFSSGLTNGNEWTASQWDLRALEHGGTYKWFVRAYDENATTMMQSETMTFVYDPFCIALCADGDVNGDGNVDLLDAILALKVLSGVPTGAINLRADVDGDGKIGIAEVGYILQIVAGNRSTE